MMFELATTCINILPKYGVTLQNVEFRQCKIQYGYLMKIAHAFVKNDILHPLFINTESKRQSGGQF